MSDLFPLRDEIIYQEMMAHPVVFSHPHPERIALLGSDSQGILQELLKHTSLTSIQYVCETSLALQDNRIESYHDIEKWLQQSSKELLDVLIIADDAIPEYFNHYFSLLNNEGILIQKTVSPFHLSVLKSLQHNFISAGFSDIHFLSFSQPHFPSGWRTAILAQKQGNLPRIREKDIFNKSFSTRYYNFDIHKASLVLPEFMREELEPFIE